MRYSRVAFEVEAVSYEPGLGIEDGFEPWADVVIHGWISTDNLIKIRRDNGTIVCPYINTRRGRLFVEEQDYVITDADGTRHLCGKGSFLSRYSPA